MKETRAVKPTVEQPSDAHVDSSTLPSQSRKLVIGSVNLGTAVEYYDFAIYGYMATYLAALFFVQSSDTAALLGAFATFAVAYLLRIPGGILFGHIGDKYGRKTALTWTISLMAAATVAIGLLPTYYTLGVWATVMLVLARCVQGFSAGGEVSGGQTLVAETAPPQWRAVQISLGQTGVFIGTLVASVVGLLVSSIFSEEQILNWAWRTPFLISLIMGGIAVWIRFRLDDSPQFKKLSTSGGTKKVPIKELLATSASSVIKIAFLGALITGGYYIVTVYAVSYLMTVGGLSATTAFLSSSISLVLGIITLPIAAYVSDKIGRKPVLFFGAASAALLGFPMFWLMASGNAWLAIIGQAVLFWVVIVVSGASHVTYIEMLSASVRYSGLALGTNISLMAVGGTAPVIATWLTSVTGSDMAPGGLFVATALATLGAVFFVKETKGIELSRA